MRLGNAGQRAQAVHLGFDQARIAQDGGIGLVGGGDLIEIGLGMAQVRLCQIARRAQRPRLTQIITVARLDRVVVELREVMTDFGCRKTPSYARKLVTV